MAVFRTNRPTIYDVPPGLTVEEYRAQVPDAGSRRYLSFEFDFDARAYTLGLDIEDHWEPSVKEAWAQNKEATRLELIGEFGGRAIASKVENFIAIGTKPMSVMAYHNQLFPQVRDAYVMGQYYPALVGACALGERLLNHLILDMRPFFVATPEYKSVYRKASFDNWDVPIDTLEAWCILRSEAAGEFRALKLLRHRSLHFNVGTYATLKEDALAAIHHMRTIIDLQFGTFGNHPWFIAGTKGHVFIRREWEANPYVRKYFLPRFPFVGPLFGMAHSDRGWEFFDVPDYGDRDLSDEEFAAQYNDRDPTQVVAEQPQIERLC